MAAAYGNSETVKKLLIKGADRGLKNKKGETPMDIATNSQFKRI